jgi:hypothetical protein
MGDGSNDGASDEITVEQGDANVCARIILAMINTLAMAKDAGGVTQDDMVSLLQNWIKLSMHFQRGGEAGRIKIGVVRDARKQALALAYAKGRLLADFKADPKAPMIVQSREDRDNPPKSSRVLFKSLNQLMNFVFDDHELGRKMAFNDAEGAFAALYYNYRTQLAANRSAEQHFRNLVARLRDDHIIR